MPPRLIPSPKLDRRSQPRAIVCATALIMPGDRCPTEHMIYDLSVGGARLCGIPHAEVGARMRVALCLPRATVRASARLLRASTTEQGPAFAIEFCKLRPRAEDAIQDAALHALSGAAERPVLLLQGDEGNAWDGWKWLDPLSPICLVATNVPDAFEYLDRYRIEFGLVSDQHCMRPPIARWPWGFPEVSWRTIDQAGRLRRVTAGA